MKRVSKGKEVHETSRFLGVPVRYERIMAKKGFFEDWISYFRGESTAPPPTPAQGGESEIASKLKDGLVFLAVNSLVAATVSLTVFGIERWMRSRKSNQPRIKEILVEGYGRSESFVKKLDLNEFEEVIAECIVDPREPGLPRFTEIGGHVELKHTLLESVLLPLQRPDIFVPGTLMAAPRGVLLYGPPGTGKTFMIRSLAKQSGFIVFINLKLSSLASKWYGDTEKLIEATFSLAAKLEPCVLFLDEIDSFLGCRSQSDHEVTGRSKAMFMSLWDGFSEASHRRVVVIGTSNRPWDLDPAVLRRMPRSIHVGLPDENERKNIFETILRGVPLSNDIDFSILSSMTSKFSASDIKELCRQACLCPLRDFQRNALSSFMGSRSGVPDSSHNEDPGCDVADDEESDSDDGEVVSDRRVESLDSDDLDDMEDATPLQHMDKDAAHTRGSNERASSHHDNKHATEPSLLPTSSSSLRPLRMADFHTAMGDVHPSAAAAERMFQRFSEHHADLLGGSSSLSGLMGRLAEMETLNNQRLDE